MSVISVIKTVFYVVIPATWGYLLVSSDSEKLETSVIEEDFKSLNIKDPVTPIQTRTASASAPRPVPSQSHAPSQGIQPDSASGFWVRARGIQPELSTDGGGGTCNVYVISGSYNYESDGSLVFSSRSFKRSSDILNGKISSDIIQSMKCNDGRYFYAYSQEGQWVLKEGNQAPVNK